MDAGRIIAIRRSLHRWPELAFEEGRTAELLMRELSDLGLPFEYGGLGTGVVGRLEVDAALPTVALRAEMDGLPCHEDTGLPFASEVDGKMHACGHDAHMAMVIGAAMSLAQDPPPLNVAFVFQPAEERGGGSRTVLSSGVIDDVSAIFAGHVTRHYQVGEVMVAVGTVTAQSDRFTVHVHGKGGHGARPHEAIDAVVICGLLVTALQTLVSRTVDPLHPSVVTIGRIEAGTAPNVIADTAVLEGTIRSTVPDVRDELHAGIRRMARAFEELHAASISVEIRAGYPSVVNTSRETELARQAVVDVLGPEAVVRPDHPSMGAEDFSFYLQEMPGCYLRFGARPPDGEYIPLHSRSFDVDERVLAVGASVFDRVVRRAGAAYERGPHGDRVHAVG